LCHDFNLIAMAWQVSTIIKYTPPARPTDVRQLPGKLIERTHETAN